MNRSGNRSPSEMTAAGLKQKLFELNGIQQPGREELKWKWDDYFKACLLTTGMKMYGEKGRAQKFMEDTWTAWIAR